MNAALRKKIPLKIELGIVFFLTGLTRLYRTVGAGTMQKSHVSYRSYNPCKKSAPHLGDALLSLCVMHYELCITNCALPYLPLWMASRRLSPAAPVSGLQWLVGISE